MNKESKSKFNLWLSEHPKSFLPSDEARMFDFVNSLYETEGNICIALFPQHYNLIFFIST